MTAKNYERACREAIWSVNGIGRVTFKRLLKFFGSGRAVWEAKEELIKGVGLPQPVLEAFLKKRCDLDLLERDKFLKMREIKVRCYGLDGEQYPKLLGQISKVPPVVYIKGNIIEQDQALSLAVVGTRKPTSYGIECAQKLVYGLINREFCIISGLARGIDGVAHRSALKAGGRTIAVLGGGVDNIFPKEHENLANKILAGNGALVSMFKPGEVSLPGNFVARNRLIAGLSLGVLVIEGAKKSGTRITADYAIEQKKPIFAVPGQINSIMSEGPTELLKMGATVVTEALDIVERLKQLDVEGLKVAKKRLSKKVPKFDSQMQEKIWNSLAKGEMEADEIVRELKQSIDKVSVELVMMEMEGLIKKVGVKYSRAV